MRARGGAATLRAGQKLQKLQKLAAVEQVAPVGHVTKGVQVATVPSALHDRSDTRFASEFGQMLRTTRRLHRLRVRHLADAKLTTATLRAAERGELHLDRRTITQLASRYGLDLSALLPPRDELEIGAGSLHIGPASAPCDVGQLDSMLTAYLRLVGQVRAGSDNTLATLRSDDVRKLADSLGTPCTTVISRLGDLVGASGAETRAMMDLYLTGASVVGLQEPATASAGSA